MWWHCGDVIVGGDEDKAKELFLQKIIGEIEGKSHVVVSSGKE